ncbi:MAG: hypothetical protein BHW00_05485 [Clostridium sp. 26_22]|nr:MAG: hypothetical protein BHW00_05485 [Clostridium sp. 26_22]
MENASKALIMAGGVLIGVLIISLAVYLFVSFGQTSAEINSQNAQKQINQFNSQFTSYEGNNQLTAHDLITVTNFAIENNKYYDNDSNYIVEVFLNNTKITDNNNSYIPKRKLENETLIGVQYRYNCKILSYHDNGRIWKIQFKQENDD